MFNPSHSSASPVVFNFQESAKIRLIVDDSGNLLIVLPDICQAVDYSNPSKAIELIDEDDLTKREVIDTLGRTQTVWCTTEPGLYQFLCSSHVQKAKAFRKWVFSEVLPSIRKQGYYGKVVSAIDQARLEKQLRDYLKDLQSCSKSCAFSHQLILDRIKIVCRQLGQPVPDMALIGKDPRQTILEGF